MSHVPSILFVCCLLAAPSLRAQTESEEEIAQLRARIVLLEERLARIESSVAGNAGEDVDAGEDVEIEVERVVELPPPSAVAPSWTEGLVLDGDLRYRHETINDDAFSVRHRHRMRARANATATLNEDMQVGFGLATGGTANDSANQSFDEGFSRKSVGVDLAFFDWSLSETLTLVGGKMSNPFFRPGGYHLLYDGDIRPEGLALRVSSGTFFANAAAFWAEERGSDPDTMWYGLQAGYSGSPARGVSLTAGASVHELSHAQGRAPVFTRSNGQGNQLDANG
ncbi:MAG: putative porin, partial [Rhodospirillaceae bacterium]|nr:putative porin [Rhodospirillaceae bacterium]